MSDPKRDPLRALFHGHAGNGNERHDVDLADCTVVGLGDSTHGTHEFYTVKIRIIDFLRYNPSMKPPFSLFLLLLACLCSATVASGEARVDDAIARVIGAYGGMENWTSAESVSETGRVSSTMRSTDSPIARSYRYPGTLRVEIGREGGAEIRKLDGGKGWRGETEVTGPQLDAMVLQAARMALPRILADPASKVKDNGEVERDGTKYRELEVELPNKMSLVAQIDMSNWHIVRSIGRAPSPQFGTGTLEFVTDYLDFRLVDGLLFAFHEINYAQGTKTGETKLDKIHVARTGKPAHPVATKPDRST